MYFIMDGRANYNMDRAIVCEVCTALEEAKDNLKSWPMDHVVVDAGTMKIVYHHPDWIARSHDSLLD